MSGYDGEDLLGMNNGVIESDEEPSHVADHVNEANPFKSGSKKKRKKKKNKKGLSGAQVDAEHVCTYILPSLYSPLCISQCVQTYICLQYNCSIHTWATCSTDEPHMRVYL